MGRLINLKDERMVLTENQN